MAGFQPGEGERCPFGEAEVRAGLGKIGAAVREARERRNPEEGEGHGGRAAGLF